MSTFESKAKTITEWLYQNNPERASILLELQRKLGWKEEQKLVTLEDYQVLEGKAQKIEKDLLKVVSIAGELNLKLTEALKIIESYPGDMEVLNQIRAVLAQK